MPGQAPGLVCPGPGHTKMELTVSRCHLVTMAGQPQRKRRVWLATTTGTSLDQALDCTSVCKLGLDVQSGYCKLVRFRLGVWLTRATCCPSGDRHHLASRGDVT